MAARGRVSVAAALTLLGLTVLWNQSQEVPPEQWHEIEAGLQELRILDRTINQDVLKARFQLVDSYDPVLRSYRRLERLENELIRKSIGTGVEQELETALRAYRDAVTAKQRLIEHFKYEAADLRDLLAYLPGAGSGTAATALALGEREIASQVNEAIHQTLLYNLTADESYAPLIGAELAELDAAAERCRSGSLRQRVFTLAHNIRRLLALKPAVDQRLASIFAEPIMRHEDSVAALYLSQHQASDTRAARYRVGLYASSVVLLGLIAWVMLRLERAARALSAANEHLEARVATRTAELEGRNREMRAVLNGVEQALLVVETTGSVTAERSAAVDRWFPSARPGRPLWDVIAEDDPRTATWLQLGWEELQTRILPTAVVLGQLPREWHARSRTFSVNFQVIGEEEEVERVLVVASDVTDQVEQAQREQAQREQLVAFQRFVSDRAGLFEFMEESERLVHEALSAHHHDRALALHAVHTLKGTCALYGVESVARACHALETRLADPEEAPTSADWDTVQAAWRTFAAKVQSLTGEGASDEIVVRRSELRTLEAAISSSFETDKLLGILTHLQREPVETQLKRLSSPMGPLARRLGKPEPSVTHRASGVRLDARRWAPFWSSFVHVLRNAIDHGIEPPDERQARGKPREGRLVLSVRPQGADVIVECTDDGRGIDWENLRAKAETLGLPAQSEAELALVLLRGGISTKTEATEISGRGAGVAACAAACAELGGRTEIDTELGRSTTFRFIIPNEAPLPRSSIQSAQSRPAAPERMSG